MKKSLSLSVVILLFSLAAAAQDMPRFETFLGYTYTRANSATNIPAFSANGGSGQFVYNFNHWIGFVADFGAVTNQNIGGVPLDSIVSNFLFGPRVTYRNGSRFTPYVQVLFGGAHQSSSIKIPANFFVVPPTPSQPIFLPGIGTVSPGQAISARLNASQTAFAMTVGGGLDIKLNKYVSFRPVGLEYYLTRFQNYRSGSDNNQNNLRYTAGVNFTLGAQ